MLRIPDILDGGVPEDVEGLVGTLSERSRSCIASKHYASKERAAMAARSYRRSGAEFDAYRCPVCGRWRVERI